MKLPLLITALTSLALSLPSNPTTLSAIAPRAPTCTDCKTRFDNCMKLSTAQGTWCELVCRKYTCKLSPVCYDCDKGVYNCTVLNQVPTFRVPEDDDDEDEKKKKGIANAQRAELDAGTVNLPTFTADVDEGRGDGVAGAGGAGSAGAAVECPESFTCDKEGETVLRCLCGFCSVAKDGYCVPKRQVCRVIGGRGQCVRA